MILGDHGVFKGAMKSAGELDKMGSDSSLILSRYEGVLVRCCKWPLGCVDRTDRLTEVEIGSSGGQFQ